MYPRLKSSLLLIVIISVVSQDLYASRDNDPNVPPPPPTQIHGFKFDDINGNGIWDDDESSISGWQFYIDRNSNAIFDPNDYGAITDTNGHFEFMNIMHGTHEITEIMQEGWEQTYPGGIGKHTVTLDPNEIYTGVLFGNRMRPYGSITGMVFNDIDGDSKYDTDEPGLAGWIVYADQNLNHQLDDDEESTITNAEGLYEFIDLPIGDYNFSIEMAGGWIQTLPKAADGSYSVTVIHNSHTVLNFGNILAGNYGGGSGKPDDPYLIYTAEHLQAIGTSPWDWLRHFELMNDIDLTDYNGQPFSRIGISSQSPFGGVFNGKGHSITNFTYGPSDEFNIGFFGYVNGADCKVCSLTLISPTVTSTTSGDNVGGLAGAHISGTIEDCHIEGGTIASRNRAGGLVANNRAAILGCSSSCIVSGNQSVGGLIGLMSTGVVSKCWATGDVSGNNEVGGLIGSYENRGTVENCYSWGSVSGIYRVGGFMGALWDSNYPGETISNCYSIGRVDSNHDLAGGFLGSIVYSSNSPVNCYWNIGTSGKTRSAGGYGKTTSQMQNQNTYNGWDFFRPIWAIEEDQYPILYFGPRYGGGTGTAEDPHLIYTSEQMNKIGLIEEDWDNHFRLMADIDLSEYTGSSFNRIGIRNNDPYIYKPFTGTFDGMGHTISNFFYYVLYEGEWVGLFGYVEGHDAEIKNIRMVDPIAVVEYSGLVTGTLVGEMKYGKIHNCHVVNGFSYGSYEVGGLVGSVWDTIITGCSTECTVRGLTWAGGIVGAMSTITTGGLIQNCEAQCTVIGDSKVGGLVGENTGDIINSYAVGSVEGNNKVGGLTGTNRGNISDCYANCILDCSQDIIGGLVGFSVNGTISRSYSASQVTGTATGAGGLVGVNWEGTILDSFWDKEVSGMNTSAGGVGKLTDEMQEIATFAGWGFVGEDVNGGGDVWRMCVEANDYPRLSWEYGCDYLCPDGVSIEDLLYLSTYWLESDLASYRSADRTGDGVVNLEEYALLAEQWRSGME